MAMLSDCLILQDLWQEIIFGSFWLKEKCNGDVVYYLEKKVKVKVYREMRNEKGITTYQPERFKPSGRLPVL
jgi:hypothetical protein